MALTLGGDTPAETKELTPLELLKEGLISINNEYNAATEVRNQAIESGEDVGYNPFETNTYDTLEPSTYSEIEARADILTLLNDSGYNSAEDLKTSVSGSHNDSYMNLGIGNALYNDKSSGFEPSGGSSRDVNIEGWYGKPVGESNLIEQGKDGGLFGDAGFGMIAAILGPFTGGVSVAAYQALRAADGQTLSTEDYASALVSVVGGQLNLPEALTEATGMSSSIAEALVAGAERGVVTGDIGEAAKGALSTFAINWASEQGMAAYDEMFPGTEGIVAQEDQAFFEALKTDQELGGEGFTREQWEDFGGNDNLQAYNVIGTADDVRVLEEVVVTGARPGNTNFDKAFAKVYGNLAAMQMINQKDDWNNIIFNGPEAQDSTTDDGGTPLNFVEAPVDDSINMPIDPATVPRPVEPVFDRTLSDLEVPDLVWNEQYVPDFEDIKMQDFTPEELTELMSLDPSDLSPSDSSLLQEVGALSTDVAEGLSEPETLPNNFLEEYYKENPGKFAIDKVAQDAAASAPSTNISDDLGGDRIPFGTFTNDRGQTIGWDESGQFVINDGIANSQLGDIPTGSVPDTNTIEGNALSLGGSPPSGVEGDGGTDLFQDTTNTSLNSGSSLGSDFDYDNLDTTGKSNFNDALTNNPDFIEAVTLQQENISSADPSEELAGSTGYPISSMNAEDMTPDDLLRAGFMANLGTNPYFPDGIKGTGLGLGGVPTGGVIPGDAIDGVDGEGDNVEGDGGDGDGGDGDGNGNGNGNGNGGQGFGSVGSASPISKIPLTHFQGNFARQSPIGLFNPRNFLR